jgi:hypothetical protein
MPYATWKAGRIARRHPLRVLAVCGAVLAGAVLLLRGGGEEPSPPLDPAAAGAALLSTLDAFIPLPDLTPPPQKQVPGPSFALARVRAGEAVTVRAAPGGRVIERLTEVTEFGSPRWLWVKKVQGDWLGVVAPELPNGSLGWIRDDRTRLELSETRYWLAADRSERTLELNYGDRLLDRYSVTVGRPGSETPLGAFAITDAHAGRSVGPWYGCCILALSGHQPNLPPGWIGGDRMAIHGTPGEVGLAASSGCLRTTDEAMVALFARVPLGTPVFVRA